MDVKKIGLWGINNWFLEEVSGGEKEGEIDGGKDLEICNRG